jgi:DNA-binding HxlR family transcriptional regulator
MICLLEKSLSIRIITELYWKSRGVRELRTTIGHGSPNTIQERLAEMHTMKLIKFRSEACGANPKKRYWLTRRGQRVATAILGIEGGIEHE